MTATQAYLPGDPIPSELIPTSQKRRVGPGIQQQDGSDEYTCTIAGPLEVDWKRKAASIATPTARYTPRAGDLVIAQIRGTSFETYHLHINPFSSQALMGQLSFEGATKKTRPQLKVNDLVYAKVVFAQKNMEVELSCVNPSTGKAEPDGLGPLTGGMVFDVSCGMAERMLKKQGVSFLEDLGSKLQGGFEIVVGRNGRVWVDCPDAGVKGVCAFGRCLVEVEEKELSEKEQRKLVNRVISHFGIG